MVSHPETGSDSPIGSDLDRGRDKWHDRVGPKWVGLTRFPPIWASHGGGPHYSQALSTHSTLIHFSSYQIKL